MTGWRQEEKKMNEKNKPGYISRYRRVNAIWLAVWIVIGVAIVLTGWFIWHTRANILTVLGVLMVLPGAKRIVALIVAGRKKSVSIERCKAVEELAGDYAYANDIDSFHYTDEEPKEIEKQSVIWTDYIFTSTDKIMMLDFLVEKDGCIYIQPTPRTDDFEYLKNYLKDIIKKITNNYKVYYVHSDEELLKALKGEEVPKDLLKSEDVEERELTYQERTEVINTLKSLAV